MTVIAILSLLGSAFTLLMGALVAVVPFLASKFGAKDTPLPPGTFKVMMVGAALFYVVPAIWGIITSVGLFQLKEWARISIIVFSVLLILMSVLGGLMLLIVPMPPNPNQGADPAALEGVRIVMAAFAAALAGIGLWWLAFFTRPNVKQQFVPLPAVAAGTVVAPSPNLLQGSPTITTAPGIPDRPLSLTILAWFMLFGCLSSSITILLRYPAVFFTKVLTGWPATFYYLVFALVHLYVGIGLLRLKPLARRVGVAYYGFAFVHLAVFNLAPGARLRMLEMMHKAQSHLCLDT